MYWQNGQKELPVLMDIKKLYKDQLICQRCANTCIRLKLRNDNASCNGLQWQTMIKVSTCSMNQKTKHSKINERKHSYFKFR